MTSVSRIAVPGHFSPKPSRHRNSSAHFFVGYNYKNTNKQLLFIILNRISALKTQEMLKKKCLTMSQRDRNDEPKGFNGSLKIQ